MLLADYRKTRRVSNLSIEIWTSRESRSMPFVGAAAVGFNRVNWARLCTKKMCSCLNVCLIFYYFDLLPDFSSSVSSRRDSRVSFSISNESIVQYSCHLSILDHIHCTFYVARSTSTKPQAIQLQPPSSVYKTVLLVLPCSAELYNTQCTHRMRIRVVVLL